jgi:HSP20 family protein
MKFSVLPVTLAASYTTSSSAWNMGQPYGRFVIPLGRDVLQMQDALFLDHFLTDRCGGSIYQGKWRRSDGPCGTKKQQSYSPRTSVNETKDMVRYDFDVPGVKAADIEVKVIDDVLIISGFRDVAKDNVSYQSKFMQRFRLDTNVDTNQIKAQLKDGVLSVTAIKTPIQLDDKTKHIPITTINEESEVTTTASSSTAPNEASEEMPAETAQEATESNVKSGEGGDKLEIETVDE